MIDATVSWFQRNLSWSNSARDWRERLGLGLCLAGAGLLWWLADRLTQGQQILLWSLLLLMLAILVKRGWYSLFGPVLFYDLVRTTRRSRFALYRVYAYFVLILLSVFLVAWYARIPDGKTSMPSKDTVELANVFFYTFMSLQFVAAAVLTPAYTAGVITTEKERRTLEYLLATDLTNREIVLSRMAVRLANLLLMLLTGLPVMAMVEFSSGRPPELVLAGFAATAVTMASLAGLSVLCSVYAKKSRTAILHTFLIAAAYLLLSGFGRMLYGTRVATLLWTFGDTQITGGDLLDGLLAGNPVLHFIDLTAGVVFRRGLGNSLVDRLRDYAIFHGVVTLLCSVWAVLRLRGVFLKQAEHLAPRRGLSLGWLRRPNVNARPMLWKELWIEGGLRFSWFGRLMLIVLVLASFAPLAIIYANLPAAGLQFAEATGFGDRVLGALVACLLLVCMAVRGLRFHWAGRLVLVIVIPASLLLLGLIYAHLPQADGQPIPSINFWARIMGALVACVLLLSVAVRAATAITSERDRDTLDSLLTTQLESTTILFSKWLGSLLSVRWGWVWLGLIWLLGVYFGNLQLVSLPLLLLAWTIYAALLATIGLWFSLNCRSSQRAMVWTLLTTAAIGVGFVLLPMDFLFASQFSGEYGWLGLWLSRFERGLTPPLVLGRLLPTWDTQPGRFLVIKESWELPMALIGLAIWAAGAVALWIAACSRFRKLTCRQEVRRPEGSPTPESWPTVRVQTILEQ